MKKATRAEAMELRKRAETDIDPGSDLDWKAYALGRLRQHEFVLGRRKPGRDDIIEIDKQTYAVIRRIADPSTRLIKALKDVNKKFLSLPRADQQDTLEHAIACS